VNLVLLSDAEQDPAFGQFLIEQGQRIMGSLPKLKARFKLRSLSSVPKPYIAHC
jgi:hypothetical protein